MADVLDLIRQGKTEELWQRCCGFTDLDIDQFMSVQRELLLEQMERLKGCELGRTVLGGADPRTVEEFRQQVPVTIYDDYAPYLLDLREDVLPEKPMMWLRTSGRSGEYPCKWVPVTRRQYEELGDIFLGIFLLACCRDRKDVAIGEHDKLLYGLAPPPYTSGSYLRRIADMGVFDFLPPIDEAEEMGFEERLEKGFKMGMSQGMDVIPGVVSVLVAMGERFGQGAGLRRVASVLNQPAMLPRMLKAVAKSKLARRPLLPRDVWSVKGLICGGADNGVYRERVKELWGRYPLDVYGITEGVMIATQTWDYDGMTFFPHLNFLEFMPEKDRQRWQEDRTHHPDLLTLDEVLPGEDYAMVITNFMGGVFVRYFTGDVIRITSLRNATLNINLPQMTFSSRVDGIIDIAGFTRLTEKIIWQAIENSGIPYEDWAARKEVDEVPALRLYLEPKPGTNIVAEQIEALVHRELAKLDSDYADLETMLGLRPLRVTLLPVGSFMGYIARQREAGADPAHIKPAHMNPADEAVAALVGAAS